MQFAIANICDLLERDLDILAEQSQSDLSQRLQNENTFLLQTKFCDSHLDTRLEIEHLATLHEAMETDKMLFDSLKKSVAQLRTTHLALAAVFTKGNSNIKSQIEVLSAEAQRVSKYYNSLKSSK